MRRQSAVIVCPVLLSSIFLMGVSCPLGKPPPPDDNWGYLYVQSKPRTDIFIDGKKIESTPMMKHKLRPGKYTVSLKNRKEKIKVKYEVEIKKGHKTMLVKSLYPEAASLKEETKTPAKKSTENIDASTGEIDKTQEADSVVTSGGETDGPEAATGPAAASADTTEAERTSRERPGGAGCSCAHALVY